jgi:hypothetical protein
MNERVESLHPDRSLDSDDQLRNYPLAGSVTCKETGVPAENRDAENDVIYLHYVNQQNVERCPQIKFLIGNHPCSAVIDTGCEASLISEQLYEDLKSRGVESLELPTQNLVLVGAFSRKEQRVKKQAYLTLNFGSVSVDQIFLVSGQLLTPMLIGCDFCIANGVILDFQKGNLLLQNDGNSVEIQIANKQKEETGVAGSYRLNNREVIALPTPLTDPCQLEMVELPRPLHLSSSVCPSYSKPDDLCEEGNKDTFCSVCPPSGEAGVDNYCSNGDCVMNEEEKSLVTVSPSNVAMKTA